MRRQESAPVWSLDCAVCVWFLSDLSLLLFRSQCDAAVLRAFVFVCIVNIYVWPQDSRGFVHTHKHSNKNRSEQLMIRLRLINFFPCAHAQIDSFCRALCVCARRRLCIESFHSNCVTIRFWFVAWTFEIVSRGRFCFCACASVGWLAASAGVSHTVQPQLCLCTSARSLVLRLLLFVVLAIQFASPFELILYMRARVTACRATTTSHRPFVLFVAVVVHHTTADRLLAVAAADIRKQIFEA